MEDQNEPADEPVDDEPGKARALTLHLLRMVETRMDAAGIALQGEVQAFSSRLQLRIIAGAALFIALWGGIVLLAIVLPPHLRVPVLASVIAAFVIAGGWALVAANRKVTSHDVGSLTWFLDNLKQDVDVLSRSLARSRAQRAQPPSQPPPAAESNESTRSDPNDLAA